MRLLNNFRILAYCFICKNFSLDIYILLLAKISERDSDEIKRNINFEYRGLLQFSEHKKKYVLKYT